MNAICITGMPAGFHGKTSRIVNAVLSALDELGMSVSVLNLPEYYLPYYDEGVRAEGFIKIAEAVAPAKNIILAYNATDGTPSAVMKVFLEYLQDAQYKRLFENKSIMNISLSASDGEREAAEYVSSVFGALGAFELIRVCIGGEARNALLSGALPLDAVQKYAEDFYRLTRQNRVFFRSSSYRPEQAAQPFDRLPQNDFQNLKSQVETSMKKTLESSIAQTGRGKARDIMDEKEKGGFGNDFFMEYIKEMDKPGKEAPQKDFDVFDQKQEEDIAELTKLFATKLRSDENAPPQNDAKSAAAERLKKPYLPPNDFKDVKTGAERGVRVDYNTQLDRPFSEAMQRATDELATPIVARNKTCRQMTGSLPHYFQPQLANDTEAVFQLNIFGDEEFAGYLVIKNRDNEYYDGQYDYPDITIISDASIWQNVLRGKLTAQKAFMTGQLKVRGNFMLLNRFDQIYKKMS